MKLTAIGIKNLPAGKHTDGANGLSLKVSQSGAKSWIQRMTVGGKKIDRGLGSYPTVSLKEARRKAVENKAGGFKEAPTARRAAVVASLPTLRAELVAWHEQNRERFSSDRAWQDRRKRLELHVPADVLDSPINEIVPARAAGLLDAIGTHESRDCQAGTSHTLSGIQAGAAVWQVPDRPHARLDAGITQAEAGQASARRPLFRGFRHTPASGRFKRLCESTKQVFRFMILCAARPGEARHAEWSEMKDGVWTIAADKMKSERDHRVPMSRQAQELLTGARYLSYDSRFVFPSDVRPNESPESIHHAECSKGTWHPVKRAWLPVVFQDVGNVRNVRELGGCRAFPCAHGRRRRRAGLHEGRSAGTAQIGLIQDWSDYLGE